MVKLSVVIITFNEAENIGACLDAAWTVADEVVVVDSFSTDATARICQNKGARFVQRTFDGHVQQKNFALTQATYDHVLSLDADEVLSEPLQASIRACKAQWTHDGYTMNRLTSYCGHWIRHCGWYPDRKLRLLDRRKGAWTGLNPHDRFELAPGASQGHLSGDLLHYSFRSIQAHVAQVNRFTDIMAREKKKRGARAPIWKVVLSPVHKFIKGYLFQLGVLDGYHGLLVCAISAHAVFLRYAKLRELYANDKA